MINFELFVLLQYRIAISFVREKASGDPDVQMLLGSIFRLGTGPANEPGNPEGQTLVAPHQLRIGGSIAVPCFGNQVMIGFRRSVHHPP